MQRGRAAQSELLRRIVARCAHEPGSGPAPIVVFDLDGTLMDNRPRTCAILHELGDSWTAREPDHATRIRRASPETLAYLLTESLARLGVTRTDLVAEAEDFWRARFFKDDHLVHDVAVPGAVEFARDCYAAGAVLVYLTGRDLPLMGLGTFRSLRDLGFPIGVAGTEVVLKPDAQMPDEAFKRLAAPDLARIGEVVAVFDNEPANCNVFRAVYPSCASVFVDTQHTPGAPALEDGVHTIADFVR
jgi:beta-phosphoglucomutase-like phosphatase (HAD superfamily)